MNGSIHSSEIDRQQVLLVELLIGVCVARWNVREMASRFFSSPPRRFTGMSLIGPAPVPCIMMVQIQEHKYLW
jgi:hypothetical protein